MEGSVQNNLTTNRTVKNYPALPDAVCFQGQIKLYTTQSVPTLRKNLKALHSFKKMLNINNPINRPQKYNITNA